MTDTIKRISNWFETAGCSGQNPKGFIGQLKVHFEEVQEMVHAIDGKGGKLDRTLVDTQEELSEFLTATADNEIADWYSNIDRKELLDSLADQIVTAIGLAGRAGLDIHGALAEVAASNESKFFKASQFTQPRELDVICKEIEAQGRYTNVTWESQGDWIIFKDGNGKILKNPRTYFEPDLTPFL